MPCNEENISNMPITTIYDTLTVNNILYTCKNYETKDPVHHESDKKTSKPRNKNCFDGRFPTSVLAELSRFLVISWIKYICRDIV